MAITDKMKELGFEIKKTVEEKGIKDTAISAGMMITDTARKGKETFENKIEENKMKLEKQRQHITDIQNNIYTEIIENKMLLGNPLFNHMNQSLLVSFTEDFYCNVYNFYKCDVKKPLYFCPNIPSRIVDKIKNIYEFIGNDSEEKILLCYYGGSKDNFVLTSKYFYFTSKHFEECIIYGLSIDCDNICTISVDEITRELMINNVPIFRVDSDKIKVINKYFGKILSGNLSFSEQEISSEIEDILDEKELYKIKESLKPKEIFKYIAKNYSKNETTIVCTTNKMLLKSNKSDGLSTINEIQYKNIDFIDIDDKNDNIVVLNIFKGVSLEIIFQGTKIKINEINLEDARRIIEVVNASREKMQKDAPSKNSNQDIFIKIEKLAKLKDVGAITFEEFNDKKQELLNRL